MSRLAAVLAILLGFCGWVDQAVAFRPGSHLELSLEILVQQADGARKVLCRQQHDIDVGAQIDWAFSMTAGRPEAACDSSLATVAPDAHGSSANDPAFAIQGSLKAITVQQMQYERVLEIDSEIRTIAGRADPASEEGAQLSAPAHRKVAFGDEGTVYIPVTLPALPDWRDLSDLSVMLKISARDPLPADRSVHGQIRISDLPTDAQILLDGGQLSGKPASGDWTVQLIAPGVHELEARMPDGTSKRKLVRVRPSRTAVASFRDIPGMSAEALQARGENSAGYMELHRSKDDSTVIHVPAGEFLMGNEATERSPQEHRVVLDDFLIDKTAVSWRQYKLFASDTGSLLPPHDPYWGIHDDEPAVYVTWEEARAYCQWAGARLPTEAEREKAARGTDARMYPWGNEEPTPEIAAFRLSWGYAKPVTVDSYPESSSPYGALNMGGNVWEWCADWYQPEYNADGPVEDPRGPDAGTSHVVRGGSWDSRPSVLSASARNFGHRGYREGDFGFRCAMDAPKNEPLLSRPED